MSNITKGVIGIVTLLSIFGGTLVLTEDQLKNMYYCDTNNNIGMFDKLSSTGKTGYWTVDNVQKSSVCTNSKWIPLKEYCASKGYPDCKKDITLDLEIAPDDAEKIIVVGTGSGNKYICTVEGCYNE